MLLKFRKILEKQTFDCLYSYLEKYDLFTKQQYGIRKKLSTAHTSCNIYDRLKKKLVMVYIRVAFFLKLTKVFHTIDHAKLLGNMHHLFEIRNTANQLFESYLSNRKQNTKVGYLIT